MTFPNLLLLNVLRIRIQESTLTGCLFYPPKNDNYFPRWSWNHFLLLKITSWSQLGLTAVPLNKKKKKKKFLSKLQYIVLPIPPKPKQRDRGVFGGVLTRIQVHKSDFLKTSTVQRRENTERKKGGCGSQSDHTLPSGSPHVVTCPLFPPSFFLFFFLQW